MATRDFFTNSPFGLADYTANFFHEHAADVLSAQLACPFFTNVEPLKVLRSNSCEQIRLLVRLCESTSPEALGEANGMEGVQIRFFTNRTFHAKFYILGEVALVGSANMTMGGLRRNRELSLVVSLSDERFDDIPTLFDELWDSASVLTTDVLAKFSDWHRALPPTAPPLMLGIDDVSPKTINQATHKTTSGRSHLQTFHRYYYEGLIPSYRVVEACFQNLGVRHPAFAEVDIKYEIDRFLSWAKLNFTTEALFFPSLPILPKQASIQKVEAHIHQWVETQATPDLNRLNRLAKLKHYLSDRSALDAVSFEHLTDALIGCAAFEEQLRFTPGALVALVAEFQKNNSLGKVKASFGHLAFDTDEFVRRIYDCIYLSEFKIRHFGRSCVLELFGWVNGVGVPPFNIRGVKALRYFGFDVKV